MKDYYMKVRNTCLNEKGSIYKRLYSYGTCFLLTEQNDKIINIKMNGLFLLYLKSEMDLEKSILITKTI